MRTWQVVLLAATLALPTAAAAQQAAPAEVQPETLQRAFVFLDNDLRVTIAGEAPAPSRWCAGTWAGST